jgi:hypothetical protein
VEGSTDDFDETFEVSGSPDGVYGAPQNEGTNVCRVAALSTMFGGSRAAIRDVGEQITELGFPPVLSSAAVTWEEVDWSGRLEQVEASPDDAQRWRASSWERLFETAQPESALAFVIAVLGSELERESAAAAAVLWRHIGPAIRPPSGPIRPWLWDIWEDIEPIGGSEWADFLWWGGPGVDPYGRGGDVEDPDTVSWRPQQWSRLYNRAMVRFTGRYGKAAVLGLLVRWRLAQALRSLDPITRSLATSAFLPLTEEQIGPPQPTVETSRDAPMSTMIHGTFGWKGDWWRPGPGQFHDFILNSHRVNLYGGGARFSWSGAYSTRQRSLAASDFGDWAGDRARGGLETVFAHSYGGEVAARSRITGTAMDQIVLLSSPVNGYIDAVATDPALSIVDVRLNFDPVLAVAGTRQRIRPLSPNVTEVILAAWRLDHGATHSEAVWNAEQVAARGGI